MEFRNGNMDPQDSSGSMQRLVSQHIAGNSTARLDAETQTEASDAAPGAFLEFDGVSRAELLSFVQAMTVSLKKLETHLIPRTPLNADSKNNPESRSRDEFSPELDEDPENSLPFPETLYYDIRAAPPEVRASWAIAIKAAIKASSFYIELEAIPGTIVDFPQKVSDSSWTYCVGTEISKSRRSDEPTLQYSLGRGRSHFIAPSNGPDPANATEGSLLYTPYSQSPWTGFSGFWIPILRPMTDDIVKLCRQHLFNLWTLPGDGRVVFSFQQLELRGAYKKSRRRTTRHLEWLGAKLKVLIQSGGLFQVKDNGNYSKKHSSTSQSFTYSASSSEMSTFTAEDAEDHFVDIPPLLTKFDSGKWKIIARDSNWRRLIVAGGLPLVFTASEWNEICQDSPLEFQIFTLHRDCTLHLHEISLSADLVFHIVYMKITGMVSMRMENGPWETKVPVSDKTSNSKDRVLSRVASTISSIRQSSNYWTIIAYLPRGDEEDYKYTCSMHMDRPAVLMLVDLVGDALFKAAKSWSTIERVLEELLTPGHRGEMLIDDEQFSFSRRFFWAINVIEEGIPLITNAVQEWDWYRKVYKLDNVPDRELYIEESALSPRRTESKSYFRRQLVNRLNAIEEQKMKLIATLKEFERLHSRAESLRTGLFNFMSVKSSLESLKASQDSLEETKQSRLLGENVKLLTYVTIFYLPLAFCTSLWSINSMFGTGIPGFAIITSVIGAITYLVTFGLLKQNQVFRILQTMPWNKGDQGLEHSPEIWEPQQEKRASDSNLSQLSPIIQNDDSPSDHTSTRSRRRLDAELREIRDFYFTSAEVQEQRQRGGLRSTFRSLFYGKNKTPGSDHELGEVRTVNP